MTGIPQSVLDEAQKADEHMTGSKEEQQAPEQGTPTATPEQPQSQTPNTSSQPTEARQQAEPQPPAQPTEQPTSPTLESLQEENRKLSASLNVLRGKFDNEVPRYAEDNRHLRDENEDLRAKIAELQTQQPPKEVTTEELQKIFSEDTLDAFTEETLREFVQAQQAMVSPQLRELQEETQRLRNELRSEMTQTSEQAFQAQLFDRIPAMRELDADEGFNDWLDEPIAPGALTTRREDFNKAYQQQDLGALSGMVQSYNPASVPLAGNSNLPVTPTVQSQIVPTAEGTMVQPTAPVEEKSYSPQEYQARMNDIAIGAIKGDAAKRLQEDLDRAVMSGLIK